MKNSFEADKNEKNNLHLQDLANNSFIQVSQVRTRMFGRCHTIMFKSKVRKISDFQKIKFKRNNDLKIFIHERGNEFWLKKAIFPTPIDMIDFPLKLKKNICNGDLTLQKKQFVLLNKQSHPCKDYDFTTCAKKTIFSAMKKEGINCTSPLWNEFEMLGLPICSLHNASELASHTIRQINKKFLRSPSSYGCPIRCTSTKYSPKLVHFDESAHYLSSNDFKCKSEYILYIYYSIDPVEITKEYLVYDAMTIISAIGGTMGLLLGYSMLSMFLSVIKIVE